MYRVWFERPLPPAYLHLLDGVAEVVNGSEAAPDAIIESMRGADAVIASARIRYDGALMDQVPSLRVISRTGIGYDNISISDATARRIAVCNAPDGPTISTAEHALALILSVTKRIKRSEAALRRGGKQDYFSDHDAVELCGLCLGLIGLGRIGSRVAKYALALGMIVIGFDPALTTDQALALGVTLMPTVEEVLRNADIVSLHAPFTAETRRLMNAERLAMMKHGAFLINTSRGALVDEAALLDALQSGHLRGAGLDVFDPEPPAPDNPLLARDDVVATPHVAGGTAAGKDRLWRTAIEQALQVLRGEQPPNLVNPEVWPLIQKA